MSKLRNAYADVSVKDKKTAGEIKDLYDHYDDFANYQLSKATEISLLQIVSSFENFRKTNHFLEIGFGEGGMLFVAEKNGWNCFGTEFSPQVLNYGEWKRWIISKDAILDERFPKNGFDVVTTIDLVEPVPNPEFFFNTACKLLISNGLLFLITSNIKSFNRHWLGD